MTTYEFPDALQNFKKVINGRRLYILFYSATIDPKAKVLCIEVTLEAFEALLIGQKVTSFIADFGVVITIEKIETFPVFCG